MGRRIILAMCISLAAASAALAQSGGTVTGRVTSADGAAPVPGATVILLGTTRGAVTDSAGRYRLAGVPAGAHRFEARRIGFLSNDQTVTVAAGQTVVANFTLANSPITLEAVKTVGYGTQEARTVTGAVSTVSAQNIAQIATADPAKALQGRVAGVEVVASNNEPGSAMQVRIRGVRSLTASNEPLYVVDGIPISGSIQDFNPAIIESIDVLKDAAATAIYGSRGANGVILVTTKKGPQDGGNHAQYTLDAYSGRQDAVKIMQMMNAQQYTQMMQAGAFYNNGALNGDTSLVRVLAGQSVVKGTPKKLYAYQQGIQTDWLNLILHDSHQANVQASLMGSTNDTRYAASGNFFDQGGLIPGQGYRRGAGFASIDHSSSRLHLGVSTNVSRIYQDIGESGAAFGYAAAMQPYGAPYNFTNPDSTGLYDPRPDDDQLNINPLLENRSFVRQRNTNRVFGSAFAEFKLLEGLTVRSNFGPDFTNVFEGCYNDPWTHGPCANPGANSQNQGGAAAGLPAQRVRLLVHARQPAPARPQHRHEAAHPGDGAVQHPARPREPRLAVCVEPPVQHAALVRPRLGHGRRSSAISPSGGCARTWAASTTRSSTATPVSATGRADGSSRLAPGNKWAFFPSFGFAWQLGDEPFFKRFSAINALKLRASYGTTGNTAINPYATEGLLTPRVYTFGSAARARLSPGRDPEPRPRLGEDRPDGRRPGVRHPRQPRLGHGRLVPREHARPAPQPGSCR